MKTITVTETTTKQMPFPYKVPCVFKYSTASDDPILFDTDEFGYCYLIRVDENYKISDIKITKIGILDDADIEYDIRAKSIYNLGDILTYKMIETTEDWWVAAKGIISKYWGLS